MKLVCTWKKERKKGQATRAFILLCCRDWMRPTGVYWFMEQRQGKSLITQLSSADAITILWGQLVARKTSALAPDARTDKMRVCKAALPNMTSEWWSRSGTCLWAFHFTWLLSANAQCFLYAFLITAVWKSFPSTQCLQWVSLYGMLIVSSKYNAFL